MEPIEFRDIAYILDVNETRGFSRAAEKYFISQPALSKTVRKAEQKLGVTIFDRSSVPLKLTHEGARVIEYFEKMQALQKELSDYCTSLNQQRATDLYIGAPPYFCTYLLPSMISDFKDLHPGVNIRLIEVHDHELRAFLLSNLCNIAVSVEAELFPDFSSLVLTQETIILAVPKSFEINARAKEYSLTLRDLKSGRLTSPDCPLVPVELFAHEKFLFLKEGHDVHRRALTVCHDAGFEPDILIELDQPMTAYYLAQSGRGVTFVRAGVPFYTENSDNLLFYRIGHPAMCRPVLVLYGKKTTPIQRKFLDFMKGYPIPM